MEISKNETSFWVSSSCLKNRLDARAKMQTATPFGVYFSSVFYTRQDHSRGLNINRIVRDILHARPEGTTAVVITDDGLVFHGQRSRAGRRDYRLIQEFNTWNTPDRKVTVER